MERLPNELLVYVFEYLSYRDLYRAIYNLNTRLNALCHTLKLHLNLASTKLAFDDYCINQQLLTSQVYSLKLSDQYDRLTLFHQYTDMSKFTNLRALTLRDPSPQSLGKTF